MGLDCMIGFTHPHGGVRFGDVDHRRIELLLLVVGKSNHRAGQRHANGR